MATEKQIGYIRDLVAKRQVDAEQASECIELIEVGELTKKQAGAYIDAFLAAPKRAAATRSPFQEMLASIPKSRYAIPTSELEFSDADDRFTGDLVFVELKEFQGTLYMRQLHGAPGRFNRSRMSAASVRAIVGLVSKDAYAYAKLFGDHYTCCGSCGAELTDQRSRELMLGPECRKKFGF
jgi:hypothetical protein